MAAFLTWCLERGADPFRSRAPVQRAHGASWPCPWPWSQVPSTRSDARSTTPINDWELMGERTDRTGTVSGFAPACDIHPIPNRGETLVIS